MNKKNVSELERSQIRKRKRTFCIKMAKGHILQSDGKSFGGDVVLGSFYGR